MQTEPGFVTPTVWAALRYWCAKLSFLHFREDLSMKSDIEIAQEAKMKPITEIAASLGLADEDVIPYGRYKAKINHRLIKKRRSPSYRHSPSLC